jgi:TPR repeat protein
VRCTSALPLSVMFVLLLLSASGCGRTGPSADGQAKTTSDYDAATLRQLRSAAEQGSAEAQTRLGTAYSTGLWGPKDEVEALKWYRKAGEQGNANAQYYVAQAYLFGHAVPKDDAEARRWFRRSAEQGDRLSQADLSEMYALGQGGPRDDVLAYMWVNLAAAGGQLPGVDAPKFRDELARRMTPEQIAEAQRLSREWKPK